MFHKINDLCKRYISWFFLSLLMAIVAHTYYLLKYEDGLLMKGINDGLSQMLPFKMFIYENYQNGDFFYSDAFGLGGGFFSQLGYYYTTNIYFLIVSCLLYVIHLISGINVDLQLWVALVLPMSIVKLTFIIFVAFIYFRTFRVSSLAAYTGAIVYAISPMYFRHEMYWDFFSDAFFWFILLLIGIERIMTKRSNTIFIIAATCTLINNFYFAYINFLLAFMYIIIRQFFPITIQRETFKHQMKKYSIGIVLSFGLSAWAFIPAVSGYLNNFRPAYTESLPLIDLSDNILFNPRVLWLPVFVIALMMCRKLYRNKIFLLFLCISIIGTIGHFLPIINSVFNGFSAPQNRWEAIVYLGYAGIIVIGIEEYRNWRNMQLIVGTALFIIIGWLATMLDPVFHLNDAADYAIPIISIILMIIYVIAIKLPQSKKIIVISTIIFVIVNANIFQANRLDKVAKDSHAPTIEFMNSDLYNSEEQRQLIATMQAQLKDNLQRIDWMAYIRNNTPIVQQFKGVSIYSSILNKDLLMLYHKNLQIDMGRESVSRYATFGGRANLMSLWQVQFYMREGTNESIPYGFNKVHFTNNYAVYENSNPVPAFRKVHQLVSEEYLENENVLSREHVMLQGAIIERSGFVDLPLQDQVQVSMSAPIYHQAEMKGDILTIYEDGGGLEFDITPTNEAKDLYVSFFIEGVNKAKEFILKINEYETSRKESDSIYKTGFNDITVRIQAQNKLMIRLPKGNYRLSDIRVFEEDYKLLHELQKKSVAEQIEWENDFAYGQVEAKAGELLITPIPFEKGWHATINGEEVAMDKVNYAFIGLPLQEGVNDIQMHYKPPYFKTACIISIVAFIFLFLYRKLQKRKEKNIQLHQ